MKNVRLTRVAGALALALGVSASAFASDTSSAMRGKITTPTGDAAANVKVTVIHEPTGTVSTFTTNDSGAFIAKGLRVGGPYRVVIDSDKYSDAQLDNIFLELGDTHRIINQLEPLQQVEKIEVTGYKIVQQAGGSNSVFGADTIENAPSFNNDIKDVARINPLASINGDGELTIAGNNPRSNSLTVDGIGQNDDFGLAKGGYPTVQPPVALDAIEQISVDASPFSAKKGNFGGGTINAVTKSGSNEYTFTGFYEHSSPSLGGKVENMEQVFDDRDPVLDADGHRTYSSNKVATEVTEKRLGFSTGGAIIKDELFYFVNYNAWRKEKELGYGFAGSGADKEFVASQADYDQFITTLNDVYGIQDTVGGNPDDSSDSVLVKLSWNINDAHRADFTYQWQNEEEVKDFQEDDNVTVQMQSSLYTMTTKFNNFATKIYSDWSDDFTTEFGIAYKDVSNTSVTNSDLGEISVYLDGGRGAGFQFGSTEFRHNNVGETETLELTFDATYLLGEHEIGFGAQYKDLRLYNLFAENSKGSWTFGSLEDFANKKLHISRDDYRFSYGNAYTNDANDMAYDSTRNQFALYVEDKFYPTDDLEVTAGLRYERLSSSDEAQLNQNFLNTYGYSNTENLDGLDIILPRVGFKYYATESLTINGGIGRFQGGIPNVWYNAPFQNDGITYVTAPQNAINDYFAGVEQVDITRVPDEIKGSLVQGAGSTNYTDPNFELPSSVRAQVGFEYDFDSELLGDGYKWTAELAYHKKENEAVWRNTAITPVGTSATGRVIYESIYEDNLKDNFDIMMTNSKENGRSVIFSTSLAKEFENGLYVSASYTHQDVEDVNPGSSSRAQSNYQYATVHSRNVDLVGRGHYEVEHNFKLTMSYNTEFFDGYASKFNVFFERRSGRPFSYTMGSYRDGDLGDTRDFNSTSAYLAYIPSGANDANVNWDESSLSWAELETLLNRAGISERGQLLDRNTGTQPWVTTMDVSFKQEIPGFYKDHKGEFYVMIENFANLLNSDWGVEKKLRFSDQAVYDFGGLDDNGKLIIEPRYNGADVRNYTEISEASAWRAKIGIRYTF
ncbi:TonB-dependent receptor [Pseudoalteromonas byunsanensis]|uniref:TonB-dependent transporter Oar-like beta-barrel domain-containing protein n=1 Tax=Pseudoalteromonas byunsanensis TaxID=327939 RepID=A0A1S1N4S3_9GAMM|nr:TonB-dependent receptor [Pseudoalteromonas byunsanensis]OHU94431.1 hypothetical protein BIW53_15260 [Pseudoalteromonas byunsanensis]